jgi:hypothetical protein
MSTTKEVQRMEYTHEGVHYVMHVEETDEGARWGTWDCRECGTGGSTAKNATGVAEAVAAAKDQIESHHAHYHQVR